MHICQDHPLNPKTIKQAMVESTKKTTFKPVFAPHFKEWLTLLENLDIPVFVRVPSQHRIGMFAEDDLSKDNDQPRVFLLFNRKVSGTASDDGGDTRYDTTVSLQDQGEFESWDKLLENFWPEITHRELKHLFALCGNSITWNVNEYYGDSSNYQSDQIDLEKLFAVLKSENRLQPVVATTRRFEEALMYPEAVYGLEGALDIIPPPKKFKR